MSPTVWHQGENTPAAVPTLTELADKLAESVHGDHEYALRTVAEEVEQALRGLAVPATAPNPVVNQAQMEALPPGRRVLDNTGDAWFKLPDGRWSFKNVTTASAAHMVNVWGPIILLPGAS